MEQAQYWMWMRRRNEVLRSHFRVSVNSLSDSWEEKAFAKDAAAAGSLGGCVWPPRSYSCSFCRREFRSAQALGGHMNVHRRDRARLKQSLSPNNNEVVPHQNHNQDHYLDHHNSTSPSIAASRVSALSAQENFSACSIVQELHDKGQLVGSDTSTAKRALNNNIVSSEAKNSTKLVLGEDSNMCLGSGDDDHVETSLSVGLNSVFFQNRPTAVTCGEEAINYKRPKINAVSALPLLVSEEKYSPFQWQVLGLKPATSREDLDLELRLGILPKVK